jgi:TRAP-type C4-dicarboxylate transport system permease small subunit
MLLRWFSAALDVLERVAIVVSAVLLVLMGALMNTEVTGRYLFGRSTQISDEYAGYLFTAMTVLCFVPALRRGRFLNVEGLVARLPRSLRVPLDVVGALIGAGVSLVLAWASLRLALTSLDYGSVSLQPSQTPLAIPQAVVPLGLALLALAFVERAFLAIATGSVPVTAKEPLHGLD